jgi:hypothetical protein
VTYVQDNAGSVRGRALRVTQLGPDGAPVTGSAADVYLSGGFISFSFTAAYNTGNEVQVTNAAGEVCVYYKLPDTLKNVTLKLDICDPDPVLTQMLVGGDVLTAGGTSAFAPAGSDASDLVAVGYAAESTGLEGNPNGVSIEVWADAIINGKSANRAPYWHYLIPHAKFRLDGDRVVDANAVASSFAGEGQGNESFGTGPNMDLTGVTPVPAANAFDWGFPGYTDRAFLYARTMNAPIGLKGVFANLGVAIVSIDAGDPATYNPSNATRPASLAALRALGALGNTTAWTSNQYVTLADSSEAYWDGTTWNAGRTPAVVIPATGATAGSPGSFTPSGATAPANLAALSGVTASPTTAWTTGQRVVLGDSTTAHWDGTQWAAGSAP